MKEIKKLPEFKQLKELPSAIQKAERHLSALQKSFSKATDQRTDLKAELERIYAGEMGFGTATDKKKAIRDSEQKIERLQNDIDQANSELKRLKVELIDATEGYKKKAIPIIDKKIKALRTAFSDAYELNEEMKEIAELATFGRIGKIIRVLPFVPFVTDFKNPLKPLDKRIQSWSMQK